MSRDRTTYCQASRVVGKRHNHTSSTSGGGQPGHRLNTSVFRPGDLSASTRGTGDGLVFDTDAELKAYQVEHGWLEAYRGSRDIRLRSIVSRQFDIDGWKCGRVTRGLSDTDVTRYLAEYRRDGKSALVGLALIATQPRGEQA